MLEEIWLQCVTYMVAGLILGHGRFCSIDVISRLTEGIAIPPLWGKAKTSDNEVSVKKFCQNGCPIKVVTISVSFPSDK